ncbi:hypothetical protein GVN20_18550 [Runella sp. CRIBMP]|uniref:LytR/AlgR family response regulator transcription factor n=1 Tax=Runella sp. CRIBMP TaxID=2683261 RepID=UPI001412F990|nr:LytTR family DNA-binding domain-containing protein [Runella sp. CRIBMP]NBB21373.1 hypothetical protein [Runella sp. CRIBMP]
MNPQLFISSNLGHQHFFSFDLESVVRLEGVRNYTRFIPAKGQPIITCRSLGIYLEQLPQQFVRVHKSYVINCRYILGIDPRSHSILMTDGTSIPISRRKRTAILRLLGKSR